MTHIESPLSANDAKPTIEALQATLIELLDLSLAAKQAHWNVVGPHFRSVHRQLDDVVAVARKHADVVAERAVALGGNPDGRPETVIRERCGDAMPSGHLSDGDAVRTIATRIRMAGEQIRQDMRATEEPDPPTQDLLNSVLQDLEEQAWMLQAMAS